MNEQVPVAQQAVVGLGMPIVSTKPVTLPTPAERGTDLQLRVSAPASGQCLGVIVFSHGFGSSLDGYAPLADYWAASGFVVIQPTHLDSRTLNLAPDDPRNPLIWRTRVYDLVHVIDALDEITSAVPGLAGRTDPERIAVAGHSWGAGSASALIGARVLDAGGSPGADMTDPRVRAAVLFCFAGTGGADLTPFAAEHFSFMSPDFSAMTQPALIVAGDRDQSILSTRGPDWWADGYHLSPGEKALVTLAGAEHSLGGISGYTSTETTDESPARVALIQRLSTAYLKTTLEIDPASWATATASLIAGSEPLAQIASKPQRNLDARVAANVSHDRPSAR